MSNCPKCGSENTTNCANRFNSYRKDEFGVCMHCAHEWSIEQQQEIARLKTNLNDIDKMILYSFAGSKYANGSKIDNDPVDAKVRYLIEQFRLTLPELVQLRDENTRLLGLLREIEEHPHQSQEPTNCDIVKPNGWILPKTTHEEYWRDLGRREGHRCAAAIAKRAHG